MQFIYLAAIVFEVLHKHFSFQYHLPFSLVWNGVKSKIFSNKWRKEQMGKMNKRFSVIWPWLEKCPTKMHSYAPLLFRSNSGVFCSVAHPYNPYSHRPGGSLACKRILMPIEKRPRLWKKTSPSLARTWWSLINAPVKFMWNATSKSGSPWSRNYVWGVW